jgi:hypothetical protein
MVAIAIANGIVREALFARFLSPLAAGALSTLTLLALLTIYIALVTRRWAARSMRDAATTGVIWGVLTIGFEFAFGAATGESLDAMLEAYDLLSGNLWVLVPLSVAAAPAAFFAMRR